MDYTEDQKREMRIAVAQDVLKQIECLDNPLIVKTGSYMQGNLRCAVDMTKDLQDIIDLAQKACHVCAKGAVFMSYARLYDNVPLEGLVKPLLGTDETQHYIGADEEDVVKPVRDIFSADQLDLIECAFERFNGYSPGDLWTRAREFGLQYDYPKYRLKAIMENVVENDGTFIP